eukprot:1554130-Rhodomonas_salina.1
MVAPGRDGPHHPCGPRRGMQDEARALLLSIQVTHRAALTQTALEMRGTDALHGAAPSRFEPADTMFAAAIDGWKICPGKQLQVAALTLELGEMRLSWGKFDQAEATLKQVRLPSTPNEIGVWC